MLYYLLNTHNYSCSIGLSFLHFDKTTILERGIPNSLSRAWRLGRAILRARREKTSPVEAILNYEGGKHIANGKVGGFTQFLDHHALQSLNTSHVFIYMCL